MKPQHIILALLVAAIWGVNFTVVAIGLGSFPPLLLVALRFVITGFLALFIPRPKVSWPRLISISTTLFLGQFAFLFSGMAIGLPAGLASVTLQSQAFLTILIAALALGEKPTTPQMIGTLVAFSGLAVISVTAGGANFSILGLVLCLAAAFCWATGNVLLRGAGKPDMLALIVWLSLIPPLPLFGLSLLLEGPAAIMHALLTLDWQGVGAVLYIAIFSTLIGYGIWGQLLKLYPAATVAPFSLLVPIFGVSSAAIILGERFGPTRLFGMALVLAGLVVVVFWPKRLRATIGYD